MIRFLLSFLLLGFFSSASGQLHISIDQIPENTPENEDIYIAGNFQGWSPGEEDYKLYKIEEGHYAIDINPSPGLLEFKFTRGSWETVEGNENGGFLPNREYNYTGGLDTLSLEILSWEDVGGANSTAAENVQIWNNSYYMPELNRNRRIWVYLPPDYETSGKDYPVLYMHDGQNVFDDATSFVGEWHVDETLNDLFAQGDYGCIVVAIDNGGTERLNEYSPWYNSNFDEGGLGDEYLQFIVNTLKPDIDSEFRTKPERDYTGIMGSSMGGLISLYGGVEHQDVFSKIGSFSPAYWFAPESYDHVRNTPHEQDVRLYTIVGELEGSNFVQSVLAMNDALDFAGYTQDERKEWVHPDGQHSEWYWDREFGAAYLWLFGQSTNSIESLNSQYDIAIYPNPTDDILTFEGEEILGNENIIISNTSGKLVKKGKLKNHHFSLRYLVPGMYYVTLEKDGAKIYSATVVVK